MASGGPLVWQRFEWSSGADRYRFEVENGGLLGTLTAEADASAGEAAARRLTLPMVAWEGMLDCIKTTRKARSRPAESGLPARSGTRWSDTETLELAAAFEAGHTIDQLAAAHARSPVAIESQLVKIGLLTRTADGRVLRPGPPSGRGRPQLVGPADGQAYRD
ncbi:MAG: hypothetical protein AB1749_11030 [Pseudomonadota bacterium]